MEVSLTRPKVSVAKPEAFRVKKEGFCLPTRIRYEVNRSGVGIGSTRCGGIEAVTANQVAEKNQKAAKKEMVELFVGLPLDVVSLNNCINYEKAIKAGLRALKLAGIHGVELPVFWAVVQPDSSNKFNWSSYLAIADMARSAGLKLRVSLQLNGSDNIPLPNWVLKAAEYDQDILFKDRAGPRRQDCLSFAVDELPVLQGKKPVEIFKAFFMSFKSTFQDYFGSTITDISISLGPNGELRYPNYPPFTKPEKYTGPGEFQCYDKYTLLNLKNHSQKSNNPFWGLSGPHDAPKYDESPESSDFFKDNGSWVTRYGDFFLSWYSQSLLDHGERILNVAQNVFHDLDIKISAKVPVLNNWHEIKARAVALTAGFYNGYDKVAEMFAKYNCRMIISNMDLLNHDHNLFIEIKKACEKHGVILCGQNSSLIKREGKFIEKLLLDKLKYFTYQRMGAEFFSPEHWPLFMNFVRGIERREMDSDDLVSENEGRLSVSVLQESKDKKMEYLM